MLPKIDRGRAPLRRLTPPRAPTPLASGEPGGTTGRALLGGRAGGSGGGPATARALSPDRGRGGDGGTMEKLVKGVHQFQSHVFGAQRDLFARLAQQQAPGALFITCSDSRISPNLLTQTGPGDLFVLRNAGNLAPSYGAHGGGEAATIEYAVAALGVRDVIVCGHTNCGAMKALIGDLDALAHDMPLVGAWLGHAAATRRIVREKYQHLSPEQRWVAAVEENVLVQLENLRTHPAVAAKLARGELNLHGWVYSLETGEVYAFRPEEGEFLPLSGANAATLRAPPSRP